jgi:phosphoserine phosphatase
VSNYNLCCVSENTLSSNFLADIQSLIVSENIFLEHIQHLTEPHLKAINLSLKFPSEIAATLIKTKLMDLSNHHQIDMALMSMEERKIQRKLIVFDMDSTLIQHEVIDEMAMVHGIGDKVKMITEKAMNGELNFDEALKERVALLKGLRRDKMEEILSHLKLTRGAEKLIKNLQNEGYKTAIISGGFKFFAESFKQHLNMDYAFANDLEFDGDVLSGRVAGKIINAQEKARLLEVLADKEKISLDQVVAVGDGANDLPMLSKAGFGIAFHAKESVRLKARHQMAYGPMTSILFFLGVAGDHFDETT